jgi:hypothetical protein
MTRAWRRLISHPPFANNRGRVLDDQDGCVVCLVVATSTTRSVVAPSGIVWPQRVSSEPH